jgi:simple sugar transport system permease protein
LVTLVNNVLVLAGIPSAWRTFVGSCFIVLAGTVFAARESS